MRKAILLLGVMAAVTHAQSRLIPIFQQSDNWSCIIEESYACQKSNGCQPFDRANDPLVGNAGVSIELMFAQKKLLRPAWAERLMEFQHNGIYTVVKSADADDTVFMRILNDTGEFVEAMTTSDEWTITSFGLCRPRP